MSETVADQGPETSVGQQPDLPGRELRRAREAAGLGVGDVARQLHLAEETIQFLEADEYDRLAGATYVSGYLRSYARTVGLDEDVILAGYQQSTTAATELMPEGTFQPRRRGGLGNGVLIGGAVAIFAVLAVWWWNQSAQAPEITDGPLSVPAGSQVSIPQPTSEPATSMETRSDSELVAAEPGTTPEPVSDPQSVVLPDPQTDDSGPGLTAKSVVTAGDSAFEESSSPTTTPAVEPAAEPAIEPGPAVATTLPAASASSVTTALEMVYHSDSWTEVRDARGTALVYRMVTAGSLVELSGVPPFTVVLGYAPGVSITYNGRPFDLTAFTRNDIARATIGVAPQTEAQ